MMGGMDEAWSDAERILPDGWWIDRLERRGTDVEFVGGRQEHFDWWAAVARGPKDAEQHGNGASPADALRTLAVKLSGL